MNIGHGKNMLSVVNVQLVKLIERAMALPKGHQENFSDFSHFFNTALIVYYYSVIHY